MDRREILASLVTGATFGLAGCVGWSDSPSTDTASPSSTPSGTPTPTPERSLDPGEYHLDDGHLSGHFRAGEQVDLVAGVELTEPDRDPPEEFDMTLGVDGTGTVAQRTARFNGVTGVMGVVLSWTPEETGTYDLDFETDIDRSHAIDVRSVTSHAFETVLDDRVDRDRDLDLDHVDFSNISSMSMRRGAVHLSDNAIRTFGVVQPDAIHLQFGYPWWVTVVESRAAVDDLDWEWAEDLWLHRSDEAYGETLADFIEPTDFEEQAVVVCEKGMIHDRPRMELTEVTEQTDGSLLLTSTRPTKASWDSGGSVFGHALRIPQDTVPEEITIIEEDASAGTVSSIFSSSWKRQQRVTL